MYEYLYLIGFIVVMVLGIDLVIFYFFHDIREWMNTKYRYYRIMTYVIMAIMVTFVLMSLLSKYTSVV